MREELELFAHNLNVYMDMYGYNQTTLANKIDVGVTTVSDWVHGRKFPRINTLDKLTELFHCMRSDLLEKYTTEETIQQNEMEKKIMEYISQLNSDGYEHLLRYFADMNPKFFRGEDDVQG